VRPPQGKGKHRTSQHRNGQSRLDHKRSVQRRVAKRERGTSTQSLQRRETERDIPRFPATLSRAHARGTGYTQNERRCAVAGINFPTALVERALRRRNRAARHARDRRRPGPASNVTGPRLGPIVQCGLTQNRWPQRTSTTWEHRSQRSMRARLLPAPAITQRIAGRTDPSRRIIACPCPLLRQLRCYPWMRPQQSCASRERRRID